MRPEPRAVTLSMAGLTGATLTSADAAAQPVALLTYQRQPDAVPETRIFVRAAPGALASTNSDFTLKVETADGGTVVVTDAKFETPKETRK